MKCHRSHCSSSCCRDVGRCMGYYGFLKSSALSLTKLNCKVQGRRCSIQQRAKLSCLLSLSRLAAITHIRYCRSRSLIPAHGRLHIIYEAVGGEEEPTRTGLNVIKLKHICSYQSWRLGRGLPGLRLPLRGLEARFAFLSSIENSMKYAPSSKQGPRANPR